MFFFYFCVSDKSLCLKCHQCTSLSGFECFEIQGGPQDCNVEDNHCIVVTQYQLSSKYKRDLKSTKILFRSFAASVSLQQKSYFSEVAPIVKVALVLPSSASCNFVNNEIFQKSTLDIAHLVHFYWQYTYSNSKTTVFTKSS